MNLIALSALFAAICLDQRNAFQLALSQPLITCSLLGMITGNYADAMYFGLIIQLIWLGNLPVGASTTPEGNIASVVGCLLYINFNSIFQPLGGLLILLVYLYTILLGFLGGQAYNYARNINIKLFDYAFNGIRESERANIGKIVVFALLIQFVSNWIFILFFYGIGNQILQKLAELKQIDLSGIWSFVEWAILGTGIGLVISVYKKRKYKQLIVLTGVIAIFVFQIV